MILKKNDLNENFLNVINQNLYCIYIISVLFKNVKKFLNNLEDASTYKLLGVQKSSELFFVKFNLYSYVIVRKWLAA